jgi:hypothetical protein
MHGEAFKSTANRRREETMIDYHRSTAGRLMALALALPLLGGAIFPWNTGAVPFFTFAIMGGVVLAFIAVGLSLGDYPSMAIAAMLALPVALFLYIPLVGIVVPQVHGVVYVMAVAACVLLAIAVRPQFPARPTATAHRERTA